MTSPAQPAPSPGPNKGSRKILMPVLRFLISFGLIGFILFLFRGQLPAVAAHLRDLDLFLFSGAFFFFFASLVFIARRLQLVLAVHDARVSVGAAYYVNIIALFFNNVLPSTVGGEMVKAYYLYRRTGGSVAVFSAVLFDRLFGLITVVGIGVAAVAFGDRDLVTARIVTSIATMAAAAGVLLLLFFSKPLVDVLCSLRLPFLPLVLVEKLRETYQALHGYRGERRLMLQGVALTVCGQISFVLVNYLLARSLDVAIPLGFFFFFVPIILILGLAPSVNGIGVREATYLFFLSGFTSSDKALALSLLSTVFMILAGIVGGVVYAFRGGLTSAGEEPEQMSP